MEPEKVLEKISEKEKQIVTEEKKITKQTEKLLEMKPVMQALAQKEETIAVEEEKIVNSELNFFQRFFVSRAKKHKILFQLIILLGVVLVWRGLWDLFDQIPVISSALISIVVGLFLLWLFNRITDLN